jgi:lipase chaperone LimK
MATSRVPVLGVSLLTLSLVVAVWAFWPEQADPLAQDGAGAPAEAQQARSLDGTTADGDLRVLSGGKSLGELGSTLPYAQLKRLFDYHLSTVGELSIEAITRQINTELTKSMAPGQLHGAQALLTRYLDYKRALVTVEEQAGLNGNGMQAIRARFTALQALRAKLFNAAEEQGMFGFEDAYDRDALTRLEIDQNPALTADQKRQQLAVLDAALPATLRADREAPRQVIRLDEKAQAMRSAGASEQAIFQMRALELGDGAAQRLAEVDQEELVWKSRIAAYLSARANALQNQAGKPESERQAAISALQQAQFTPQEQARLAAYEP